MISNLCVYGNVVAGMDIAENGRWSGQSSVPALYFSGLVKILTIVEPVNLVAGVFLRLALINRISAVTNLFSAIKAQKINSNLLKHQ